MIISTLILTVCVLVVLFELLSMLMIFRSCRNIRCTAVSSEKVCEREDGYLIREYWNTGVTFELDGTTRSASLETSTFCQKGQVLSCYYYPKKNLVFRKRDIKAVLRSYTIPAFSVGLVFLLLTLLFSMTSLGGLIVSHIFEATGIILLIPFTVLGIGFTVYSVSAFRHTSGKRVTSVSAQVTDVIRKTKSHRENTRCHYYPIFRYKLGNVEHNVTSRIGRDDPPEIGSTENVLADIKKGGLVEYKDVSSSFVLGVCFLLIACLLLYMIVF